MVVDIEIANWETEKLALQKIRTLVFVEEQGVAQSLEWDEADTAISTSHLIARLDNAHIGCLRLVREPKGKVKITRLAVLRNYRQQGIGAKLLIEALDIALGEYANDIYLHAQIQTLAFYEKHGFRCQGEIFKEAGIAHQTMYFDFSDQHRFTKLYGNNVRRFNAAPAIAQHLQQLASSCRRRIDIISKKLNPDYFADTRVLEALSVFIRGDRHAKMRLLIEDCSLLEKFHHPIIDLYRRLSPKIEIRQLSSDAEAIQETYCLFDSRGILFFNDEEQLHGFAHYNDGPTLSRLHDEFEHLWDHCALSNPNLGEIYL